MPRLPLFLAAGAALVLLLGAVGTRLGLWDFRTGFLLLRVGAWTGLAAAALTLLVLVRTRPDGRTIARGAAVLAVGLAVAYIPWSQRRVAFTVPPIHDITTDMQDPPAFVAVLPLRAGSMNGPEYGGDSIAAQQRRAYPDVVPITLAVPPAEAFTKAAAAARRMNWDLVAEVPAEGRLEATATTFWFGFKDDVVIRIRPTATGSLIDVRSKSRLGVSDVGANANRIRQFRKLLLD